jgi:hypothetical protein
MNTVGVSRFAARQALVTRVRRRPCHVRGILLCCFRVARAHVLETRVHESPLLPRLPDARS